MPVHPDPILLVRLQTFLSRGQHDYDWVASRIHAACYNDEYVMQKVLGVHPQDVPSSEDEEHSASEASDDADEEDVESTLRMELRSTKESGSKDDPVVLGEDEDAEIQQKDALGKRKRIAINDIVETTAEKAKHSGLSAVCLNCGLKFNTERNKHDTCRYHPSESVIGELELNPLDEQIQDDEFSRETWPNAFQWECCEANFDVNLYKDSEPCTHGKHRADGEEQTEYSQRHEKPRHRRKYYGGVIGNTTYG